MERKYMVDVIIKEATGNYEDDTKKIARAERILSVSFDKQDDTIFFNINIDAGDHFVTVVVDRQELIKAVADALVNPALE